MILARMREYCLLTRLHRPIGSLLLLWPTLWALWFASEGPPPLRDVLVFSLGVLLMRSAGCAINDYADRDFDRHVKRTADRPITAGRIRPWEALAVFAVLSLAALLLILPYNRLSLALAAVAAFLAASYPYTKRFLSIPQAYLGLAFGFGIPMAFAALSNTLPPLCWLLLLANVSWAVAYDTEYAMVDRDDDLLLGIRTSAITFGRFDVPAVMAAYGCTILLLFIAGRMAGLGLGWYAGLALAAMLAAYHYTLIRGRSREGCFKAFNHNNWFGAAVFAGLPLDWYLRQPGAG